MAEREEEGAAISKQYFHVRAAKVKSEKVRVTGLLLASLKCATGIHSVNVEILVSAFSRRMTERTGISLSKPAHGPASLSSRLPCVC